LVWIGPGWAPASQYFAAIRKKVEFGMGTAELTQSRIGAVEDRGSKVSVPCDKQRSYRALFDSFTKDAQGKISPFEVLTRLRSTGIRSDDPRIQETWKALDNSRQESGQLDLERFIAICQRNSGIISRGIRGELIIPDFTTLAQDIETIYQDLLSEQSGSVADYIPQLGRVDPEQLAIAVCTVDGQRFSIGDYRANFCLQSVCKPVNYLLALEEHGADTVHRHVGCEPSGVRFNELSLNDRGLPHNPMINSGAIMSSSLIRPSEPMADRFDYVADVWRQLASGGRVGFNNAVYLSERDSADRNFALGYFMREKNAFPAGTNLVNTLEFYFQCCSIEIDADSLSAVAATLASGGVSPLTENRVFRTENVQRCLSLMSSCGMYDYSGEFAFRIGLPAKSGVSGALLIVVPRVMGIAVWSPRLDALGNSVRGIKFSQMLTEKYNFHAYDSLVGEDETGKRDPRLRKNQATADGVVRLCWAASQGDLDDVRGAIAAGTDPSAADYDGRTALHLAASEGRLEVVRYLLQHGADLNARDRWGGTPATDAKRGGHSAVARLLSQERKGVETAAAS
jgi:glutaminase